MQSTSHMPKINYREDAIDSTSPYSIYTCKLMVDGQEVLTDPEGYILDMMPGAKVSPAPRRPRKVSR